MITWFKKLWYDCTHLCQSEWGDFPDHCFHMDLVPIEGCRRPEVKVVQLTCCRCGDFVPPAPFRKGPS